MLMFNKQTEEEEPQDGGATVNPLTCKSDDMPTVNNFSGVEGSKMESKSLTSPLSSLFLKYDYC